MPLLLVWAMRQEILSSTSQYPVAPRAHIQPFSSRIQSAVFQGTAILSHPKICRPTTQARDTISPSDSSFPKSPLPPHPTCLPTAFFLACKLGLNLQQCCLHPRLEPSPVPSLAWHLALEASAPPNSIPTLCVGAPGAIGSYRLGHGLS